MNPTRDQLIEKFGALVSEHGHDWQTIASLLNKEEIIAPKGGQWNRESARSFYKRNSGSAPRKTRTSSPSVANGFPGWMDKAAAEDLRQMLEWWRARGTEKPVREVSARPVFRGTRRNSGIHVNKEILTRAMDKAKTDKVRTGGSLSLLVEWLLWRYIGEPEDVLEPLPEEPSE